MARIAIVGAGVAGLSVAYGLRMCSGSRTVFEKSRGYGGRAATRGRDGWRYDHGAPFFGAPSARVEQMVTAHLSTAQLMEIGRPVGIFTAEGQIELPAPGASAGQKWTYRQGISTLGKLLAQASGADVRHATRIEQLEGEEGEWVLRAKGGACYGPYDAVVLTPPAPQSARILGRSALGDHSFRRLQESLTAVDYAPQFAYVFAYDRMIARPDSVCGLSAAGTGHPIAWIGFEHDKVGRVPRGHSLLVVHTAAPWTGKRVDRDPAEYEAKIRRRVAAVLSARLDEPLWTDTQRWRYARPQEALDPKARAAAAAEGVYVAGDVVTENGTVGEALDAGLETAGTLRRALEW